MAELSPCCDGNGQVHHGDGALSWITLCPNGCGSAGWDAECADERELQSMATDMIQPQAFRVAAQRELSKRAANVSVRERGMRAYAERVRREDEDKRDQEMWARHDRQATEKRNA